SIVYENVNFSIMRDGGLDRGLDAVVVADIQRQRQSAPVELGEFGLKRGQRGGIATGNDEIGPGAGEGARKILAKATAGAGDESDFAGEGERILVHGKGISK